MSIRNNRKTERFYLHHYRGGILERVREIIFGLEDGMVSTLGVIIGIAAGTANRDVVLLSGLVVVIVEALSMSAGTYLSNKSENELKEAFLREELEEIKTVPKKEQHELLEILKRKGFTRKERSILSKRITSSQKRFLNFMALNALHIFPGTRKMAKAIREAVAMWISYAVGGSIALIAFVVLPLSIAPIMAVLCVAVALFLLGVAKGLLLRISWLASGFEMMLVSLVAAGLGHVVGLIARQLIL